MSVGVKPDSGSDGGNLQALNEQYQTFTREQTTGRGEERRDEKTRGVGSRGSKRSMR